MQTANQVFIEAFNAIQSMVDYQPEWANGTGYMDYAVFYNREYNPVDKGLPIFEMGEMVKSVDPHGRKIIIIASGSAGNLVIFQRSTGDDTPIVSNAPKWAEQLGLFGTSLTPEVVAWVLGDPKWPTIHPNLVQRMEEVVKSYCMD